MTILSFSRDQLVAMSESGLMNKKTIIHWDICNDLKKGHTLEYVADTYRMSVTQVWRVKQCKCSD